MGLGGKDSPSHGGHCRHADSLYLKRFLTPIDLLDRPDRTDFLVEYWGEGYAETCAMGGRGGDSGGPLDCEARGPFSWQVGESAAPGLLQCTSDCGVGITQARDTDDLMAA
jgi:hypothetical protein